MKGNPRTGGWTCRPTAGRTRARRGPSAGSTPVGLSGPGPAVPGQRAAVGSGVDGRPGGGEDLGGSVRVRFVPSDVPVLTCRPADRPAALRGAAEALARLGRSHLGGSLVVTTSGPACRAADEGLAAARAVENALRGGCGTVQVPPPVRWPPTPGCPCPTTT